MTKLKTKKNTSINLISGGEAYALAALFSIALSLVYSIVVTIAAKILGVSVNEVTAKNGVIILSFFLGSLSVIFALFVMALRGKFPIKSLLFKKAEDRFIYIPLALITFGCMFGLSEANNLFVSFLGKIGFNYPSVILPERSVLMVGLTIVFVCVIPPIVEEVLFRGAVLNSLRGFNAWIAAVISAAAFSVFHMSPAQTVYQFIVGLLYALIAYKAKSWVPTAISHTINNLYIVLNHYFWGFIPTGGVKIFLTAMGAVSLIIGIILLLFFRKENYVRDELAVKNSKLSAKNMILGFVICGVMWIVGLF